MTFVEGLTMALIILGVVVFFISFTNVEMITGLWVAGDIKRDKQFMEAGQFRKRIYLILRIAGIILFVSGILLLQLNK